MLVVRACGKPIIPNWVYPCVGIVHHSIMSKGREKGKKNSMRTRYVELSSGHRSQGRHGVDSFQKCKHIDAALALPKDRQPPSHRLIASGAICQARNYDIAASACTPWSARPLNICPLT